MKPGTHNLASAIIAITFLVILQWFAAPVPVFRYLIPAYIVYLAAVGIYNFLYLRSKNIVSVWIWMRPFLFLIAWFGLYLIVPDVFLRGLFLIISLVIIYFFEFNIASVGENILFNQVVFSAFGFYISLAAAAYYFLGTPSLVFIGLVCAYTLLLSRASLETAPTDPATKWFYSLLLALFTTQIFWTISFLPLHYTILGFWVMALFCFIGNLCHSYLLNTLTLKKIQFNSLLLVLIFTLILISTPWTILVS